MRYLITSRCLTMSVLVAGSVWAAGDAPKDGDRSDRRAEMRQKMLNEFDADGNGELNEGERANAREKMRARRGGKARGAKGAKGARGAKKGRKGRGGRPDPGKMFEKFDANGDGQLSRREFMKLAEAMRAHRQQRGPGKLGDARPGGPPIARRDNFDRDRPLQSPGDRPGPPPRSEGRRRLQGDDGPRDRPRGPKGRGPGRQGPPDPAKVFERFDENGDDQLSREEFMKLADHMREMRKRHGSGDRGDREGRGPRRGPPGEDGPPRGRRPRPSIF